MIIVRDPEVISGFRYESPLEEVPAISHCGEALCSRHHKVGKHSHAIFEFTYLVHGKAFWQIGGRIHEQKPGDLFVACPGQTHFTAAISHPEYHQFWIGLDVCRVPGAGRILAEKIRKLASQNIPHSQETEGLFRGIIRQVVAQEPHCEKVTLSYVSAFLSFVEQRLFLQGLSPANLGNAAVCYSYPIQKVIAFMRENRADCLSLREMAHLSGCSISKLCESFRKEVGVSPYAYHFRLRLDAARDALLRPEATITEVAGEYGFSSSQHFSMAFRRVFRVSPRDWRKGNLAP